VDGMAWQRWLPSRRGQWDLMATLRSRLAPQRQHGQV
jgi:hypothetical protein